MRLKKGDTFELKFVLNQRDVETFANVTGDMNPIHLDEKYAANTRFRKPIVHGFLAGSVFSKVLGTLFPGEGTIYLHQELDFRRPIRVAEDYVACFEVIDTDSEKHIAEIWCQILDSETRSCLDGVARVLNLDRI